MTRWILASLALVPVAAAHAAGPLAGWGAEDFGAINVPAGTFTAVAAGSHFGVAIRSDGTLAAWGYNGDGRINVPSGTFTAVAAGNTHGLGIRSDGTLAAWGVDNYGELNVPSGTFTAVAAGYFHSVAIRSDGTLSAWGDNSRGQLNVPTGTFTAVAAGVRHSVAIRSDGMLVGWGDNEFGAIDVPAGTFTEIAAGGHNGAAIRSDGTLVGWGPDDWDTNDVPTGTFIAVSVGGAHGLAIRSNGTLVGWGLNNAGQINVPSGTFGSVAAGPAHSLGIRLIETCNITPGTGPDCNSNSVPDPCEIADGAVPDCNSNSVPDECDIADGTAADCNANTVPDSCDIALGAYRDCNTNAVPDTCDLATGTAPDCNSNAIPDSCDLAAGTRDCNFNSVPDTCDLTSGTAPDCNTNAVPDECDLFAGTALDCNINTIPDSCDIDAGTSEDRNENDIPDECDTCEVIDLERLRAVQAWDIEFTRSMFQSASGGGPLGPPENPGKTGFSLNWEENLIYSFNVTVAGDCTTPTSDIDTWPCFAYASPENPGEVRLEREDLLDAWEVSYAAPSGPSCLCNEPQESTRSQEIRRITTGGTVYLDGAPGQYLQGGMAIDTSVCPPRAFASIRAFPGFPARSSVRECRSCASSSGSPAGCQTYERDLPGSLHHYMYLDFDEEPYGYSWFMEPLVRMENGRFVIRGLSFAINENSPCIDDHQLCGYAYDPLCSDTNVPGSRVIHTSVVIREHDAPPPPLKIHAVEFTQGIQVLQPLALLDADLVGDLSPPIPLVAGKPAVMRVYFDQVNELTDFKLEVSGGPILAIRNGTLDPACTTEDQRRQQNACFSQDFYFTPPEGPWSVRLTLRDRDDVEQERHILPLISKKSDAIVLKAVSVCDTEDSFGVPQCAAAASLQPLVSLLKKIAPTDKVEVVLTDHKIPGHLVSDTNGDPDCDDYLDDNGNGIADLEDRCESDVWWNVVVAEIERLGQLEPSAPGRQVYHYGMVRREIPGGNLGIAFQPGKGGASKVSADGFAFEVAPWVVSHETFHMLGRKHTNTDLPAVVGNAPGCWLGPEDGPTWPYADNWIQSGAPPGVIEIGFDVQTHKALDPSDTFEVMGYCVGRNWISPHTTLGLLEGLAPSPTGGRSAPDAGRQVGPYWRVSGFIEKGSALVNPIFKMESQGSQERGTGTHRMVVMDAAGLDVFTRYFTPSVPHISPGPNDPAPDGTPFFSELIPVQLDAAAIAIRDANGATLTQIALGGEVPTVNVSFPTGGESFDGLETIAWTVSDPDSTIHMFRVEYSADDGVTWSNLSSAESGLLLVVDFSALPGSAGQSLVRVLASDGVNTGTAVSNAFSVAKKKPTAQIISPLADARFSQGTLVLLQAMGFDADEGLLKEDSLEWRSDVDGLLGNGDDLAVYHLSLGKHTIALAVADADGNTATDQVTIFIFDGATTDGDFDGDVDLSDFAQVGRCLAGPRITPPAPACRAFDFDIDGDVDQADFAVFQNCVSGTNALADPNCAKGALARP